MNPALEQALDFLVSTLSAPRALIVNAQLKILAIHGFDQEVESADQLIDFSVTVLREVLERGGRPRCDGDLQSTPGLSFSAHLSQVRSLICVPFYAPGEAEDDDVVQGLIYIDNRDQAYAFTHVHFHRVHDCCRTLQVELYGQQAIRCEPPEAEFRRPTPLDKLREEVRAVEAERRKQELARQYLSSFTVSEAIARAAPSWDKLVVFYRSLHVMLSAGLGLARTLDVLGGERLSREQLQSSMRGGAPPASERLHLVAQGLAQLVGEGESLSAAMSRFPGTFSESVVHLVRAGEHSGALDRVLGELAHHQEVNQGSWQRLRSALIYPLFSLAVALLMILLVPTACAQGLFQFLRESGQSLSFSTRVLMVLAQGLAWLSQGYGLLVTMMLLVGAGWLAARSLSRFSVEKWTVRAFRWPGVGRVLRLTIAARLARSMALMLRAGLSMLETLELAVGSTANPVLKRELPAVTEAIHNGAELSEAMARFSVLPPAFLQMVAVAETVGKTAELLDRLASLYEQELELATEQYLALIEPLVMLLVGGMVGACVLVMMVPVVKLQESL